MQGRHRNSLEFCTSCLLLAAMALLPCAVYGDIQFEAVTAEAGITRKGPSYSAAWGDFNGDGTPDLYTTNHGQLPSLYQNGTQGIFTNIAAGVLPATISDAHGASWVDFDNDGDQDLMEMVGGSGPNHLFVNTGGVFLENAAALGLDYPLGRGRSTLWYDWDLDGWLDVLLLNEENAAAPVALFKNNVTSFENVTTPAGLQVRSARYAHLYPITSDGNTQLIFGPANYPQAIYDAYTIPYQDLTAVVRLPVDGSASDVAIADFNGDTLPDIFLVNAIILADAILSSPTRLDVKLGSRKGQSVVFQTSGNVGFDLWPVRRVADIYIGSTGLHPASNSFQLAAQDQSVWGILDEVPASGTGVYIGYESATGQWTFRVFTDALRRNALIQTTEPIESFSTIGFEPFVPSLENRYLQNTGQSFEDRSLQAIDQQLTNCPSVVAGDFDNDMDIDLYLACSGVLNGLPNILYENQGDGSFQKVAGAGGAQGDVEGQSGVVAAADIDLDGFLDLFVANGYGAMHPSFYNGQDQLFRNLGNSNHWIEIDLEGSLSNRDGIGARVTLTAGGITQQRFQSGGRHAFGQDFKRLHFGLAQNTAVEQLTVEWPSGIVQEVSNIVADQVLRVIEEVTPDLMGQPAYVAGIDEGVYLWKETFDGPYHLRVTGSGERSTFHIKLVSEEALESTLAVQLEWPDKLLSSVFGFALEARVSVMDDGVDFQLMPGARTLLSVEQDGVANPRQLHVGTGGGALSPAGWVLPLSDFPPRPAFVDAEALGLFVGQGNAAGLMEARWSGNGLRRSAAVSVIASQALLDVVPQGLERDDVFEQTVSSVQVVGWLGPLSDGLDIYLPEGGDVGVAYRQDGLFPPHWVNSELGVLGTPNGYWLPAAEPYGAPSYDPATEAGLFLWKDREGPWHLRVTAGGGTEQYVGRIVSDLPATLVKGVRVEERDVLDTSNPTHIEFRFGVYSSGQDGADFLFPADAVIRLELDSPNGGVRRIQVGKARWPVGRLPLALSRW